MRLQKTIAFFRSEAPLISSRRVSRFSKSSRPVATSRWTIVAAVDAARATSTLTGRVQERIGETLNLGRHGGGEEKGLAGERHHLHDALDIGNEPHVEHAVGFVDHQKLDAGQEQLATFDMVEQPAGGRDEHVDAARDLGILVTEGHAADQQGDVEA